MPSRSYHDPARQVGKIGTSLPSGLSSMTVTCPSSCTQGLSSPVTVFSRAFHMHQIGHVMYTEQRRGGAVHYNEKVEYYNFNFQGQVKKEFQIQAGDELRTTCVFNAPDSNVNWRS